MAVISITIPDVHVPRIKTWVRSYWPPAEEIDPTTGLPFGDPTDAELMADFKSRLKLFVQQQVQQYELLEEHKASEANYTQIPVED
jgi:hypothetical protein